MDRFVITYKTPRAPADDLCRVPARRSSLSVYRARWPWEKARFGSSAAPPPLALRIMDATAYNTSRPACSPKAPLLAIIAACCTELPVKAVGHASRSLCTLSGPQSCGAGAAGSRPTSHCGPVDAFAKPHHPQGLCRKGSGPATAGPNAQRIDLPRGNLSALTVLRAGQYDPESDSTRVVITIETGRLHQIRRHFKSIGHPVMEDQRYGVSGRDAGLDLRAARLAFTGPLSGVPCEFALNAETHHRQSEEPRES
jgi:hypothetical protein